VDNNQCTKKLQNHVQILKFKLDNNKIHHVIDWSHKRQKLYGGKRQQMSLDVWCVNLLLEGIGGYVGIITCILFI
jgi:hypothetical protein